MLHTGGNAVDAAVATTFCTGVANPFSCGIGGGGFMVYFDKNSSKFHVYDYRETAPSAANETMYLNKSSTIGMLYNSIIAKFKTLSYTFKKDHKKSRRKVD